MKTFTKSSILNAMVIASLVATPVMAEEQTINQTETNDSMSAEGKEGVGFGVGVVIGAIFGGPAGAFITGLAGNLIAKEMNAKEEINELSTTIAQEQQAKLALDEKYARQLERQEQAFSEQLAAVKSSLSETSQLQAENLLMSLQFSTGSSELQAHYQTQINALANLLKQTGNLTVDLSGYTDLQGDEEYNHALSIARVNAVKKALIDNGVEPGRIKLFAFGENDPVVANHEKEVSFYDRRVVIQLRPNQEQADQNVAKNY
ncbi:sortase-associated OmpA-like protein PdsO [Thalassotalea piscium]